VRLVSSSAEGARQRSSCHNRKAKGNDGFVRSDLSRPENEQSKVAKITRAEQQAFQRKNGSSLSAQARDKGAVS
jgi:hypothetical protein